MRHEWLQRTFQYVDPGKWALLRAVLGYDFRTPQLLGWVSDY
jgi:hypothetical protein